MIAKRVPFLGLFVCLQLCIPQTNGRFLPSKEDFIADMLVPVNNTKTLKARSYRSIEGSGAGEVSIEPLHPAVAKYMERLEEAPRSKEQETVETDQTAEDEIETTQDEGSGYSEKLEDTPKTEFMAETVDDPFTREEGMEDVYKALAGEDEEPRGPQPDDNQQGNSLQANEKGPTDHLEDGDLEVQKVDEGKDEGSGLPLMPLTIGEESNEEEKEDEQQAAEETNDPEESSEKNEGDGEEDEQTAIETADIDESKDGEGSQVVGESKSEERMPKSDETEVAEPNEGGDEDEEAEAPNKGNVEEGHANGDVVNVLNTTSSEESVEELDSLHVSSPSTIIHSSQSIEEEEEGEEESTTEVSEAVTEVELELETTSVTPEASDASPEDEGIHSLPESSPGPEVTTEEELVSTTTEEFEESTTEQDEIIDNLDASPEYSTEESQQFSSTTESSSVEPELSTTTESEPSPSVIIEEEQPEEEIMTDTTVIQTSTEDANSQVEKVNRTLLQSATMVITGDKSNIAEKPGEEPTNARAISMYIIVGVLVICFIVLVVAVTLRKRVQRRKMRPENGLGDRETDKALLGNGKYNKDDSEENNMKNNEITPLVMKQNSQINKFEKNPNFSSPKNLNTTANEKNIEKDNVLKSTTQAIIEGDVEDVKKAVDEAEEMDEKKRAADELTPLTTPEKVVVHTHMDLDSIPKKPIIVSRNGNGYHPVPGGDTT